MQLEILLFAAAREAAGCDTIQIEIAEPARACDVIDALSRQLPQIAGLLPACRLAVDCSYVTLDTPISDDRAEIALIPPVSGG